MQQKDKFINKWGEENYKILLRAAHSHGNGLNDSKMSDEFLWALLICIGYACMEDKYRVSHGFKGFTWKQMKPWIKKNIDFSNYKGDFDYLSLFAGVYNEYLPNKRSKRLNNKKVK